METKINAKLPVVPELSDEELARAEDRWLVDEIRRIEAALSRWAEAAGIREETWEPGREVASVASVASMVFSPGESPWWWWYEFDLAFHAPNEGEEEAGYRF